MSITSGHPFAQTSIAPKGGPEMLLLYVLLEWKIGTSYRLMCLTVKTDEQELVPTVAICGFICRTAAEISES